MPVHDLQRPRRPDLPVARAVGQPGHERGGLLGEAEPQQRRRARTPRRGSTCSGSPSCARRRSARAARSSAPRPARRSARRSAASASAPSGAPSRASARGSATARASAASRRPSPRTRCAVSRSGYGRQMWSSGTRSSTNVCDSPGVHGRTSRARRRRRARAAAPTPIVLAIAPSSASVSERRAEQHAVRVHLDLVLGAPVVEPRLDLDLELHRPRARRRRAGSAGGGASRGWSSIGMKSCTSPTPPCVKKRVIRTFVSGK